MDSGRIHICACGIDEQTGAGTRVSLTCDDYEPSPIHTPGKTGKLEQTAESWDAT